MLNKIYFDPVAIEKHKVKQQGILRCNIEE